MMNHCDHGHVNGKECLVIYDEEKCPMCILEKEQRGEEIHGDIKLAFSKLEDGTCAIFADIFSQHSTGISLTAGRVRFHQIEPYTVDNDKNVLFNISYKSLKEFAKEILKG